MKKVETVVKLQIPAGKATPAPPVGPALAQYGLNISEFCQKFNDLTKDKGGASELLKKAAGIEKGSGQPNKTKVAKITKAQLREIAQKKMPDLNTDDIKKAMKIIEGTAKNMGIEVKP